MRERFAALRSAPRVDPEPEPEAEDYADFDVRELQGSAEPAMNYRDLLKKHLDAELIQQPGELS